MRHDTQLKSYRVALSQIDWIDLAKEAPVMISAWIASVVAAQWLAIMTFGIDPTGTLAVAFDGLLLIVFIRLAARQIGAMKRHRAERLQGRPVRFDRTRWRSAWIVITALEAFLGGGSGVAVGFICRPILSSGAHVRWLADGEVRHDFGLDMGPPPRR